MLAFVVRRHALEHPVEHHRQLPGYVAKGGTRSHSALRQSLVNLAERSRSDRG